MRRFQTPVFLLGEVLHSGLPMASSGRVFTALTAARLGGCFVTFRQLISDIAMPLHALGEMLSVLRQKVLMAQTQAHTIDGILLTKFDTIDDKARSFLDFTACTSLEHAGRLKAGHMS